MGTRCVCCRNETALDGKRLCEVSGSSRKASMHSSAVPDAQVELTSRELEPEGDDILPDTGGTSAQGQAKRLSSSSGSSGDRVLEERRPSNDSSHSRRGSGKRGSRTLLRAWTTSLILRKRGSRDGDAERSSGVMDWIQERLPTPRGTRGLVSPRDSSGQRIRRRMTWQASDKEEWPKGMPLPSRGDASAGGSPSSFTSTKEREENEEEVRELAKLRLTRTRLSEKPGLVARSFSSDTPSAATA